MLILSTLFLAYILFATLLLPFDHNNRSNNNFFVFAQNVEATKSKIDLDFKKVLQDNAAPRINFDAPNLLLKPKITHIVEIEIVKAWESALIDCEKFLASFATSPTDQQALQNRAKILQDPDIDHETKQKLLRQEEDEIRAKLQESAIASGHQRHRDPHVQAASVVNITHWQVVGHSLIALFGEQEPELVQNFIELTKQGYQDGEAKKSMADSFPGIHPISSPAERQRQHQQNLNQNGDENSFSRFTGHYISAFAIPEEFSLKHGFEKNVTENNNINNNTKKFVIERPPWASIEGEAGSRWVLSGSYDKSLAGFTFFDNSKKKNKNEKKEKTKQNNNDNEKNNNRKKFTLPLRAGALLHRDCDRVSSSSNPTKSAQSDNTPFSWYVLTSREVSQLLHTKELEQVADEKFLNLVTDKDGEKVISFGGSTSSSSSSSSQKQENPNKLKSKKAEMETENGKLKFLDKIHQLRSDTKNDRIFGQVLTGYPHLQQLSQLPQHGKIFTSHHFLNRSSENTDDDQNRENENEPFIVEDSEDNDAAIYPFVEGIPMLHVSIARATVYEMTKHNNNNNNNRLRRAEKNTIQDEYDALLEDNEFFSHFITQQRKISPHAQPSPHISDFIEPRHGGSAKEGNLLLSKNIRPTEREEIVKFRADKIAEFDRENDKIWKKFTFGRSVSAHNLENDVREARAEFCIKCRREREESAKHLKLLESNPRFGLRHLPNRSRSSLSQSNNNNNNKDESIFGLDSTLLDNFIRFSGGVPPTPNCTMAAMTWQWCIARDKELVDEALQRRLKRDDVIKGELSDIRKRERERRRQILIEKSKPPSNNDDDEESDENDHGEELKQNQHQKSSASKKQKVIINPLNDLDRRRIREERASHKKSITAQGLSEFANDLKDKSEDEMKRMKNEEMSQSKNKKKKKAFYSEIREGKEHLMFREDDRSENNQEARDSRSASMEAKQ